MTVQCEICEFVMNKRSCLAAGRSIMQLLPGCYNHTTLLLILVFVLATLKLALCCLDIL